MKGKLTVEKAAANISLFLKTIKIISESDNGIISRKDFVSEMGDFIGIDAINKDGKEQRTPYNKSKFARYFGFVSSVVDEENVQYMVLTRRGQQLLPLISEKDDVKPGEEIDKYYIKDEDKRAFARLLLDSIFFDSFGRNNCGAETSNTDIEPPKIVLMVIHELSAAAKEEICFVIYGMNQSNAEEYGCSTFKDAIDQVRQMRKATGYDPKSAFKNLFERWDVSNIVNDFKIITLLSDDNIRIISKDSSGYYSINASFIGDDYYEFIPKLSAYYQPIVTIVESESNAVGSNWIEESMLGGVPTRHIMKYDASSSEISFEKYVKQSIVAAYSAPKTNIYMYITRIKEGDIERLFGSYYDLLERVDDIDDEKNGFSIIALEDSSFYRLLSRIAKRNNVSLVNGCVEMPANLHVIMNTI